MKLEKLSYLIKNYNRNLVGLNLPDEILAHRFFECQDKNLILSNSDYIYIMENSYKYVTENFSSEKWPNKRDQYPNSSTKMALIEKDILDFNKQVTFKITICLDECIINLDNMLRIESRATYAARHNITPKELIEKEIKMKTTDKNPISFHFNELDEMVDFIHINKDGFKTVDDRFSIFSFLTTF